MVNLAISECFVLAIVIWSDLIYTYVIIKTKE